MAAWNSPTMTAANAPNPYVVSQSSYIGGYGGWKAFDGSGASWWNVSGGYYSATQWVKLDCGDGSSVIATGCTIKQWTDYGFNAFKVQGSNNDVDWTDLLSDNCANNSDVQNFSWSNTTAYRYYRIYCVSGYDASNLAIYEITLSGTESGGGNNYPETIDESLELADSPVCTLEVGPSINESLILTDEIGGYPHEDVDDSINLADSISSDLPLSLIADDELGLTDTPSCTLETEQPIISESLDLIDSPDISWLHIILETFDLSDGMEIKWLKELIETLFIYDELHHEWRVTAESSLILTDAIETLLGIIVDEWINFIDIQSNNWDGREIISEDVTLYDIVGFAKIYADSLSDEINIADVSTYQLTITVLEYLGFTELANAIKASATAINDSIVITDNPALAFPQSVESILSVVDLSTVAVQFLHAVQSDLGLADVSSLIKRISDTLNDPIIFVDTITSHAHLYSLIYDTLHLDVLVDLEGEFYECYVLNTPKFMPSMYSGFNFNSYCVFENRAFGANDTGIYELTGETDAGNVIHTGIIFSKTNFNSPNQKRFRRGYLDISGTSPKMILETEDGQRQAYAIDEQGKMVASHELKSKKWILSVADFETLDSMKLIPVLLTK